MITSGEGKYEVSLEKISVGTDLIFILRGGETPHIGGIVHCSSDGSIKMIRVGTHYDHIVLEPIAIAAWKKYQTSLTVIGGVHIDDATKEEINHLISNCEKLHKQL